MKLLKAVFTFLLGVVSTCFAGLILSHIWSWFIVPKFNLPYLSVGESIGVMIVFNFLLFGFYMNPVWTKMVDENQKLLDGDKKKLSLKTWELLKPIVIITFIYPIMLGVSYVWHLILRS